MLTTTFIRRFLIFNLLLTIAACTQVEVTQEVDFQPHNVVIISTYTQGALLQNSQGIVVEKNGFLLTSYSSLLAPGGNDFAEDIRVVPWQKPDESYQASIVAVEPTLNLAILKISTDFELQESEIAVQEDLHDKMHVLALNSVNSAEGPEFIRGKLKHLNVKECYQESMTATMLEAKISLPPENIGGPIFNESGKVIAIDTGYQPEDGHNFFVKEEYILPIILPFNIYESLKKKESYISPWTGYSVRPLNTTEKALFPIQQFTGGIAIEYVWENSPAKKLGIQVNDILVKFDYYPTPSPAEFQKWLYAYGVGETVTLHFLRNGKEMVQVKYTIEERPKWAVPK